jgi:hypothetical protein
MSSFRMKVGATAGAALLAIFLLPASAAMASAQVCSGGGGISECTYVNGTGLHINYMKGWGHNNFGNRSGPVHIELEGPPGLIKNCAAVTLPPGGNTPNCVWSPNRTVTAGNYCSTAWELTSPGHYHKWGTACVDVHS